MFSIKTRVSTKKKDKLGYRKKFMAQIQAKKNPSVNLKLQEPSAQLYSDGSRNTVTNIPA